MSKETYINEERENERGGRGAPQPDGSRIPVARHRLLCRHHDRVQNQDQTWRRP